MPYSTTIALVVTAVVLWLLVSLKLRTEYLAMVTTLLGTASGMVQLANTVYQRRSSAESSAQDADAIVKQATEQLCGSVKGSVEDLRRHLQLKTELLDVTWVTVRSAHEDVPRSGTLTDLIVEFSRLPVERRRLLILGPSASGKTVYAASLVLGLIEKRRGSGMIPVLLRYALRSPERDIVDWIADQVEKDYAGTLVREALFDAGPSPVVPVLDGVDEVGPLLPGALAELNESHRESAPLVLVCRSDLYREAVERGGAEVANAWVVELRPLSAKAVADYFGPDPRWRDVVADVSETPPSPLSLVLRNPFNAWLAKRLYCRDGGPSPNELVGVRDGAALQRRLLADFVPAVLNPAKRLPQERFMLFTVSASTRWLRFLARFLHQRDEDDLAWWELRRTIRPFSVELVTGVLAGLGYGALTLLLRERAAGVGIGALLGVFFGFAFCLAYMSTWHRGSIEQRSGGGGFRDNPSPRESLRRLAEGMATVGTAWLVAFALVALAGELSWLVIGSLVETVVVVCVGTVVALLCGAVVGGIAAALLRVMTMYATLAPVRATTSRDALARDRRATVVCFSMFAVIVGLVTASASALVSSDLALVALAGVGGGLTGGVTGVMMFFAWPAYQVRHAWLALWRRLPWRYMTFLQVARQAGVLRESGAHYQFRHQILRDFLAEKELVR
jgi:hypothetical protein